MIFIGKIFTLLANSTESHSDYFTKTQQQTLNALN